MIQSATQQPDELSNIFLALADPTRRAVIARLGQGPASVSELARPFDMGLPSFMKHIRLLETSGMIRTRKAGRTRTCVIDGPGLSSAEQWLAGQRKIWEAQTDRLEAFVLSEQEEGAVSDRGA
ncbi:ArsR/SmtB family transcription factor [Pelagibacterium xiamenense]|uniref:ArsR/SmtB family transcription factor n=1 Tax=Pelagibacterium xiamenense TaxID=2901140 RepID=UPI001E3FD34D|nr:metalloregulator ArsR/SmtB family transcription factor [Pelagibacterium xiamenense]MCD7058503.1 metalloregulator ArsR/SmtB family transcription factor [Pelagibacterium xiamenense]